MACGHDPAIVLAEVAGAAFVHRHRGDPPRKFVGQVVLHDVHRVAIKAHAVVGHYPHLVFPVQVEPFDEVIVQVIRGLLVAYVPLEAEALVAVEPLVGTHPYLSQAVLQDIRHHVARQPVTFIQPVKLVLGEE